MSDHKCPAYQATGSETLEKLVMDPNIPKSETEGWACREIERLRARVDALRWPLAVYIHALASGSNVPPHIEAAARAALKEAKP